MDRSINGEIDRYVHVPIHAVPDAHSMQLKTIPLFLASLIWAQDRGQPCLGQASLGLAGGQRLKAPSRLFTQSPALRARVIADQARPAEFGYCKGNNRMRPLKFAELPRSCSRPLQALGNWRLQ